VALIVGKVYDKAGMISLLLVPLATIPIPILALSSNQSMVWVAVVLWGTAMAIHETVMRAAIADMTPNTRRGTAYGIFNTIYGAAWFAGSALMGVLYGGSGLTLMLFVVLAEAFSIPVLLLVRREMRTANACS